METIEEIKQIISELRLRIKHSSGSEKDELGEMLDYWEVTLEEKLMDK